MLDFRDISISDRRLVEGYNAKSGIICCEYSFGYCYLWGTVSGREIAERCGALYIRSGLAGQRKRYTMPIGDIAPEDGVRRIMEDAEQRGCEFFISAMCERDKTAVEAAFPGVFEYTGRRDLADYIYLPDRLASLEGKQLHGKRNHCNRFMAEYGDRYSYEPLGGENLRQADEFHFEWIEQNKQKQHIELDMETDVISTALADYDAVGLTGGLIRVDGRVVAFTYGSAIGRDVFVVHAEKADHDIPGLYSMINREFVRRELMGYQYINREEDLGIEGIRLSKLSYKPDIINMRYDAALRK